MLDDELCYKYSEYHNIFEVYATRARMFRNVYLHRSVPEEESFLPSDADTYHMHPTRSLRHTMSTHQACQHAST